MDKLEKVQIIATKLCGASWMCAARVQRVWTNNIGEKERDLINSSKVITGKEAH